MTAGALFWILAGTVNGFALGLWFQHWALRKSIAAARLSIAESQRALAICNGLIETYRQAHYAQHNQVVSGWLKGMGRVQ